MNIITHNSNVVVHYTNGKNWLKILVNILVVIFFLFPTYDVIGGGNFNWSLPEVLFSTDEQRDVMELTLINDGFDNLLLWFTEVPWYASHLNDLNDKAGLGDPFLIYQTQKRNKSWENPIDILIGPKDGHAPSVVIDREGVLHLFTIDNCLRHYYSTDSILISAQSWQGTNCVDTIGDGSIDAAIDYQMGRIYVVYPSPDVTELRLAFSDDGGRIWNYEYIPGMPQFYATSPDLSIDDRSRLHLVYSLAPIPTGYPLLGVFYTHSDDGGKTWSSIINLGQEHEGQATIETFQDDVHILWNGDAARKGRYYRFSKDGGNTWGGIEELITSKEGHGGLQRSNALLIDNQGVLHALIHDQENLYYSYKDEHGWHGLQPLFSPSKLNSKEVWNAKLAITDGNILHAVYIIYNGSEKVIYHQEAQIDTRFEPSPKESLPTKTFTPTATVLSEIKDTETSPTPSRLALVKPVGNSSLIYNVYWPLITAVFFVLSIIGIVLFVKLRKYH